MYTALVFAQIEKEVPPALAALGAPERKKEFEAAIAVFRQLVKTHLTGDEDTEPDIGNPIPRLLTEIGAHIYGRSGLTVSELKAQLVLDLDDLVLRTKKPVDDDSLKSTPVYQRFTRLFSEFTQRLSSR